MVVVVVVMVDSGGGGGGGWWWMARWWCNIQSSTHYLAEHLELTLTLPVAPPTTHLLAQLAEVLGLEHGDIDVGLQVKKTGLYTLLLANCDNEYPADIMVTGQVSAPNTRM